MIGLRTGIIASSRSKTDPDALIYINALIAAGYAVPDPVKGYINTFVVGMKSAGLWTKITAIYPMIGGDDPTHSINAKNPGTYDLTFSGSWTHSSTGALPDGSTANADTGFNPAGVLGFDSIHLAFYSGTSGSSNNGVDIGHSSGGVYNHIYANFGGNAYFECPAPNMIFGAPADTDGWFIGSRESFTSSFFKRNTTSLGTNTTDYSASTMINNNINLGSNGPSENSDREHRFSSIGSGLTSTEMDDYYNLVQALQTSLGRQV